MGVAGTGGRQGHEEGRQVTMHRTRAGKGWGRVKGKKGNNIGGD